MKVYAKFTNPEAGLSSDIEDAKKFLTLNEFYEVEDISMGQSYTSVFLIGIKGGFNSVQFEFYNENKKELNIFKMPEFNPYLNI